MKRTATVFLGILIFTLFSACGPSNDPIKAVASTSAWNEPVESFDQFTAQATQTTDSDPGLDQSSYQDGGPDSFMIETVPFVFGEGKYTMDIPSNWLVANYEDNSFLAAIQTGEASVYDVLKDDTAVNIVMTINAEKFISSTGVALMLEPYSFDENVPLRLIVFYADGCEIMNFTEYVQGEVRLLRVEWGMDNVNALPLGGESNDDNYEVIYAFKYGGTQSATLRYYLKYNDDMILLQFTAQRGIIENLGIEFFREIAKSIQPTEG